MLKSTGKGGIIMLMAGGKETDRPHINAILPAIIQSGARVISIAFGYIWLF